MVHVLHALLLCAVAAVTAQAQGATYSNPVIPGDHPDPSIIRVGDEYWATATTSQWSPIFPLLRSRDLVDWTLSGAVFDTAPAWSDGSYWAPEISQHEGRFFVYYTARRKNGPLCVAVATARAPGGPYTDRGPLICQEVGSIDAMAVDDENGQRYLVWKEDGNSRKLPTPIWAQRLGPDGTTLEGQKHELLRNEAPWEGHLVEGPFILRRHGWFYLFYSAGACCGRQCDYKLGVARSRALLGPWERNPSNPILAGNDHWKCPGHGSIVTDPNGRDFLLYHAYHPRDFQFAGRQALLDEITWTGSGWPLINGGRGPSVDAAAPLGRAAQAPSHEFADPFDGRALGPGWQRPWNRTPDHRIDNGALVLRARGDLPTSPVESVLARPTLDADYIATARIVTAGLPATTMAGLAAYGNAANAIGISAAGGRLIVWRREKDVQQTLTSAPLPRAEGVQLRMIVSGGSRIRFAASVDGETWTAIGQESEGGYLPPWDLAVRVALAVGGPAGAEARFDWMKIEPAAVKE